MKEWYESSTDMVERALSIGIYDIQERYEYKYGSQVTHEEIRQGFFLPVYYKIATWRCIKTSKNPFDIFEEIFKERLAESVKDLYDETDDCYPQLKEEIEDLYNTLLKTVDIKAHYRSKIR